MSDPREPIIIQGGMGVAVSAWELAREVSQMGQLGVVSGSGIDVVMSRRLQLGDPGGHVRRALNAFPFPHMAKRILDRFFIAGGKAANAPFRGTQVIPPVPTQEELEVVVLANFTEVFLAKEGHSGLVGLNLLEKLQPPTLPSLYGAMLAGVDYVLMGAGIPRFIPGALDRMSSGELAELPLNVLGVERGEKYFLRFDPVTFCGEAGAPRLKRPRFLPIVASSTLATMLLSKSNGRVDGFVIEGPTAGGHNAPPRGEAHLNDRGEPIYGERDRVDLQAFRALGLPFWLAGGYGSAERVVEALELGAAGVQVGTAFAFCEESGMGESLKRTVVEQSRTGNFDVMTDAKASPTGFPFKVLTLEGSISEEETYLARQRVCDMGFLRQSFRLANGKLGWRCPAEPVAAYVKKGGDVADTVGRKCICNALVANVGYGQIRRDGAPEKPLITCGNDVSGIVRFLKSPQDTSYTAKDVVDELLSLVSSERLAARRETGTPVHHATANP